MCLQVHCNPREIPQDEALAKPKTEIKIADARKAPTKKIHSISIESAGLQLACACKFIVILGKTHKTKPSQTPKPKSK